MAGRGPKPENMTKIGSLPVDYLEPPESLTSGTMREAWDTIVSDLHESGVLDKTDRLLIESAAVMWGRARDARLLIESQGYIVNSKQGTKANPLIAVERESWKELRLIGEHLPLTRIARHRLGLSNKTESRDPFAAPAPIRSVQ